VEANSTRGQGSRRAVAPSDNDDNENKSISRLCSHKRYNKASIPKVSTTLISKPLKGPLNLNPCADISYKKRASCFVRNTNVLRTISSKCKSAYLPAESICNLISNPESSVTVCGFSLQNFRQPLCRNVPQINAISSHLPIPVAEWSKVYGRSCAETAGSNPCGVWIPVSWDCFVL
jgi:hypothetical protein